MENNNIYGFNHFYDRSVYELPDYMLWGDVNINNSPEMHWNPPLIMNNGEQHNYDRANFNMGNYGINNNNENQNIAPPAAAYPQNNQNENILHNNIYENNNNIFPNIIMSARRVLRYSNQYIAHLQRRILQYEIENQNAFRAEYNNGRMNEPEYSDSEPEMEGEHQPDMQAYHYEPQVEDAWEFAEDEFIALDESYDSEVDR